MDKSSNNQSPIQTMVGMLSRQHLAAIAIKKAEVEKAEKYTKCTFGDYPLYIIITTFTAYFLFPCALTYFLFLFLFPASMYYRWRCMRKWIVPSAKVFKEYTEKLKEANGWKDEDAHKKFEKYKSIFEIQYTEYWTLSLFWFAIFIGFLTTVSTEIFAQHQANLLAFLTTDFGHFIIFSTVFLSLFITIVKLHIQPKPNHGKESRRSNVQSERSLYGSAGSGW